MATAQQQSAVFSPEEAQRFAALWAGAETGNPSEPEAMGKSRILRRMVAAKGLRLVDALELAEIRAAIDAQLQPVRQPVPDVAAMQTEIEDLRGKLSVTVPKVRKLAEDLAAAEEFETVFLSITLFGGGACWLAGLVLSLLQQDGWGGAFCWIGSSFTLFFMKDLVVVRRHMDFLESVKEKALLWYTWASYSFFGLGLLTYLACCVIAGELVGPITYIGFLYHCSQWKVLHG